ncbi:MAG: hypothetical protein A4E41_01421 [Methanoregulaceae archaeon PtaU1.Bin066]|nr:MAG: hypothetical protein A4E41_01421 [Methanoregulaceae archaeon PtaU1.Bin066]
MKSICSWARTSPSFARSYILVFACCVQALYIPPTRGLLGCTASPPAISPMVWPISRSLWIRFATVLTGSWGENGLILVSVPGRYISGSVRMLWSAWLWSLLAHWRMILSSLASLGISQRMEASMDSIPARVWAIGQIPQTRDAIFGTWSIVFPRASFSTPLTGVMESQSPRSMIPASSTFRTSFECPSCLVVGEISTIFDNIIASWYSHVLFAIPV